MNELLSYFLIALAFAEGVIAILLLNVSKHQKEDRKKFLSAERETYKTLEKLIVNTTKESQQILQHALNTQTQLVDTIETFERSLEKQMLTTLRSFNSNLETVGKEHLDKTAAISRELLVKQDAFLSQEINNHLQSLSKDTEQLLHSFEQELLAEKMRVSQASQQQVQTLLTEEKHRIASQVEKLTATVSKKYLNQTLDSNAKHAIVMDLIETELR